MKEIVAITVGDYNGIGPEVALRAVVHKSISRRCHPLLIGPWDVFRYYAERLHIPLNGVSILEPGRAKRLTIEPGKISARAGKGAADAISAAVHLALRGFVSAIVTAPVSKKALHLAGLKAADQTELLQQLTNSQRAAMMLVSGGFRVGLVTAHLSLGAVTSALTRKLTREKILTVHHALVHDWGIKRPRLALLALNPHAGEGGDLGNEERRILSPTINALRKRRIHLDGPFPADSFFGRHQNEDYDAVIAMYHDQGLIPLKMASFGRAVNVTAGLPVVRTSPDHGTAFDIAGKGIADPGSMIEAIKTAVVLAQTRRKTGSVAK